MEYPFNEALGWTIEMGLVGLALVAWIIGIMTRRWNRQKRAGLLRPINILVLSVMISWSVFSLFSYPMEVPVLALAGVLTFAAVTTTLSGPSVIKKSLTNLSSVYGLMTLLIISCMAVYSLWWSYKNQPIVRIWIRANINYQLGEYSIANQTYFTLWPNLMNEGAYLQMAGKSLSMKRQFYSSARYMERALYFSSDPVIFTTLGKDYTLFGKVEPEKYDRAEFLLKMAKYMQPGRYYPRYLLLKFYERTGQHNKEKEEAIALLVLETKVESTAVDEMRTEARDIVEQDLYEIKLQSYLLRH